MRFPSLGGSLHFTLVSSKKNFDCRVGNAQDPISIIIINVKKEKAIKIISEIIRLPDNLIGVLKILPKYFTRKLIVKMIGKNQMYMR